MTQTTARIKKAGKNFEIMVDMDEALAFKKGDASSIEAEGDRIFTDSKKGEVASSSDLKEAFRTEDVAEIVQRIVKEGEVLVSQEHRSEEQEKKIKQIVDFLATNTTNPQTNNPHTPERIRSAMQEAHVNVKNVPVENQVKEIIGELSKVLPIKMEMKKIKITIPAAQTGQAYGAVSQYKEKENWLDNGDLEMIVNVPAGIIMDFYDKLNSATHGSAVAEEIKGETE